MDHSGQADYFDHADRQNPLVRAAADQCLTDWEEYRQLLPREKTAVITDLIFRRVQNGTDLQTAFHAYRRDIGEGNLRAYVGALAASFNFGQLRPIK